MSRRRAGPESRPERSRRAGANAPPSGLLLLGFLVIASVLIMILAQAGGPVEGYPGPTPLPQTPASPPAVVSGIDSTPTVSPMPTRRLSPSATPVAASTSTPAPTLVPPTSTPFPPTPTDTLLPPAPTPTPVPPRLTFYEFYADWCPHCQAMRPIIEELKNRYRDRVDFYFVDIDEGGSEALVRQYHVRAVPTYVLLDGKGNVANQWFGKVDEQELVQAFENALASR